ncbi:hypothetical protein [Roseovarius sp. 2305UL8-3]|uniref:hypothetical protein n=1 Tax=Roseovarius conchicola TaxID=3121636 RepID=UPI003527809F
MRRYVTGLVMAIGLGAAPAQAQLGWLFDKGHPCEPLDRACLTQTALEDLRPLAEDASVNSFGKVFGALWPHLDEVERQPILDAYLAKPDGDRVIYYMNVALSQSISSDAEVQWLADLLDDPSVAGNLPIDYYAPALVAALLKTDPEGVADLAIEKGAAFAAIAIDGLYRTIAWMARNDLARLEAYLDAHNPPAASYFNPSTHLFRIAGEICNDSQDGMALAKVTLADMLRTRITSSERFAFPMRAVVACEGSEAALAAVEDMFTWVAKDLERQKARGQDGAFVVQRIVKAVNDDGLAPVIRALHREGQEAEAATLAERILPRAQVVISVDADQEIAISKDEVQARLSDILAPSVEAASNLDPVTVLHWFTAEFNPDDHLNAPDYAGFAIDPILTLWPEALAQEAADKAIPLLESSKYKAYDLLRLRIGMARENLSDCALSEAAMGAYLDGIAALEGAGARALALSGYLHYLDARAAADAPVCAD